MSLGRSSISSFFGEIVLVGLVKQLNEVLEDGVLLVATASAASSLLTSAKATLKNV